jgi:predicted nucleic acid-binding protein
VSGPVVVDASLAAAWVLEERWSSAADRHAARWTEEGRTLIAPFLIVQEITNALYKRVRRGELRLNDALEALDIIGAFGIELREGPGLAPLALALAQELDRPAAYDCYYLALADTNECDLWTADRPFYLAARRSGKPARWIEDAG